MPARIAGPGGRQAVLVWGIASQAIDVRSVWVIEMAQFTLVSYYLLGGAWTMQRGAHVRMDVVLKMLPIHVAWGMGSESWDTVPVPESMSASTLLAEYGRRKASQVAYCTPDVNGDIEVPSGKFALSVAPTKFLYIRCSFAANDQPVGSIREVGVFFGTIANPEVPESKQYLEPSEIQDFGSILLIDHITKIDRSNSIRQQFEFVIQF
jgi:hypothetical protein